MVNIFGFLLVISSRVDDRDAGVVTDPGQLVARGREGDTVHPSSSTIVVLAQTVAKVQLLPPSGGGRLLLDLLHIS